MLLDLTKIICFNCRYVYGPLPSKLCITSSYLKNTFAIQLMLFFDAVLLTKYITVFRLKNPFGLRDEFWSLFLNIWIPSFSHLLQFVLDYKVESFGKLYYICAGICVEDKMVQSNRGIGLSVIASASIAVFLVYHLKVQVKNKLLLSNVIILSMSATISYVTRYQVLMQFLVDLIFIFCRSCSHLLCMHLSLYHPYILSLSPFPPLWEAYPISWLDDMINSPPLVISPCARGTCYDNIIKLLALLL